MTKVGNMNVKEFFSEYQVIEDKYRPGKFITWSDYHGRFVPCTKEGKIL